MLIVRDFQLFPFARQVTCCGKAVHLSSREFDFLELLMRNPDQVFSRRMIFEVVWGKDRAPNGNNVDALVSRLRRKLEEAGAYILCTVRVRGVGYALQP
ncbi:winged helix-turn-helix domain-containing protein (plasmid) [Deinococcus radiomollis]|uniref:winged helix-turn-helix domain-containing protein n=1 Tax=Deinococcus radiomollis TaxID=468916 RepID=UPI0038921410